MLFRACVLLSRLFLFSRRSHNRESVSRFCFVIRPWDCDTNGHVNNARYLSFLDWSRFQFFVNQGWWFFWGKRYYPILQSLEISYIRPLLPFSQVTISTRLLFWDDKYLYFDHQFFVKDQLHTHARCRAAVFGGRQQRQALLTLLGKPTSSEKSLTLWNSYLVEKKAEMSVG